jgi:Ca2+-binding RTX toxin-like protein
MGTLYTVFDKSAVQQILHTGDTLLVGPDGLLYGDLLIPTGSSYAETAVSIIVDGGVVSTGNVGISLQATDPEADTYHHLEVGAAGYVRGYFAAAEVDGKGASVINQGTLSGGTALLMVAAPLAVVVNTGSILGGSNAAVRLLLDTDARISNSGTIDGTDGIELAGSTAYVTNLGSIVGHAAGGHAIDGAGASAGLRISNGGALAGADVAILGSAFSDKVVNTRGSILGDVWLGKGNDTFRSSGGTVDGAVKGEVGNDTLIGSADDDTLDGGGQSDILRGLKGDDFLIGGTGADVFVFGRRDGYDTVSDFANGSDKLDLTAFHFTSFAALGALATDTAGGLLVNLAGYGDGTIFLTGMSKAQFDSSDVIL